MSKLRVSTAENPLSQQEVLDYVEKNSDEVFYVQKIHIPVKLTKIGRQTKIDTVVVARDGRKIHETSNIAQAGEGLDTRFCADGSPDRYVKKPHKIVKTYAIDDGRKFSEVEASEKVKANTISDEVREAFVAEKDLYLMSTWGKTQFVARGSIVTISNGEAIGNNNPCDMVLYTEQGTGTKVLNELAAVIKRDALRLNLSLSAGAEKFLSVAGQEDRKSFGYRGVGDTSLVVMVNQRVLKMKMRVLEWKEKTFKKLASQRIQKKVVKRKNKKVSGRS